MPVRGAQPDSLPGPFEPDLKSVLQRPRCLLAETHQDGLLQGAMQESGFTGGTPVLHHAAVHDGRQAQARQPGHRGREQVADSQGNRWIEQSPGAPAQGYRRARFFTFRNP